MDKGLLLYVDTHEINISEQVILDQNIWGNAKDCMMWKKRNVVSACDKQGQVLYNFQIFILNINL